MALRLCANEFRPTLRALSTTSCSLSKSVVTSDPFVKHYHDPNQKKIHRRPELKLFDTINVLARQRLWNGLEAKPASFLFGEKAKYVYGIYNSKFYNPRHQRFSEKWAHGKEIELVLRVIGFFFGIFLIITTYNTFVPETKRFKYKYGIKQELEEKAKHGDHHHH